MIASGRFLRVSIPSVLLLFAGLLPLSHAAAQTTSGVNLLENPAGTVGAVSAQGWDAVTIPGWQVAAGLPTVVRYGTAGFPQAAGAWPASRGRLFAGGAGGTARLVQSVPLLVPSGTRYRVSAWLGGTGNSWASVVVRFVSAAGNQLGSGTVGPVGRVSGGVFSPRSGGGVVPAGTATAQVTVVLATSLKDDNGPNAPQTGYDWAVAADLGLSVSAPVSGSEPARLTPPQHPAQRVPTIILGSTGVRQGYVSTVRYTHYSLLRTIEAALGLGTLTANDRYAQPVNDVFAPGALDAVSVPAQALSAQSPAGAAPAAAVRPRTGAVAWVANYGSGTVTPVNLVDHRAGKAIAVGTDPQAIVATPDGRTVYVANGGSGTVTPISTATDRASAPIQVGTDPVALAVTPDGRTVLVANEGSGTVTPIDVATGLAGPPIPAGDGPRAIAVTPDGRTAYVVDWTGGTVTPIDLGSDEALAPIPVGSYPSAIVISPRGGTAYVANSGSDTVTPIATSTDTAGPAIPAGYAPDALAITPSGQVVYAVDGNSDEVTPIVTATGRPGRPVAVGYSPVAAETSGATAYVVSSIAGTVTPLAAGTGRAGAPLSVGLYSYPTDLVVSGSTAVVVNSYAGEISLIDTATGHVFAPVTVGNYPVAVAVSG
jgi:YVTN family beta-propeller protein